MLLIFDTWDGLCNQFMDIVYAVNFCVLNNIKFTFRYAAFRNETHLDKWYKVPFDKLFDKNVYNKYEQYIEFDNININETNTYNYIGNPCHLLFNKEKNILEQLKTLNYRNIVLCKFRSIYSECKINIWNDIIPNTFLLEIYEKIRNSLLKNDEKYNFIHYRYENDFICYFKTHVKDLMYIINNVNFKNNYKIFIAASNIDNLININEYTNLIHKKEIENEIQNLNFEEKAFIDFMFGKNSEEIYGNKLSSFSCLLNKLKNTKNFY